MEAVHLGIPFNTIHDTVICKVKTHLGDGVIMDTNTWAVRATSANTDWPHWPRGRESLVVESQISVTTIK